MTIQEKKCFKCNTVKPLEDFYKHPKMADGRVNKCKQCNRKDVRDNRLVNIEHYRMYDRVRGSRQSYLYTKDYRSRFSIKYEAHTLVNNRIKSGILVREPCEVCGSILNIHAHHDDYTKPLDVRWLCAAHHSQWHYVNGCGKLD